MKNKRSPDLLFKPNLVLAAVMAASGFAVTPALAQQQAATVETVTLGTVVVTAGAREQAIKDAAASISVITREELDAKPYTSLQDVVRRLEGVSIVGGSPNETDISIRGLPGEYTLILVDGKRQNTRETMNRGTGGVQSSLIPPIDAIERIEVVRGPMSSLYGADAMGGVINIITRKVAKKWGGSVSSGGVWQSDSKLGNTTLGEFWLGGPIKDDVVGLQVYGKTRNRAEDRLYFPLSATAGAYGQKDESLTAKLTVKPAANQDITFEMGGERLTYDTSLGQTSAVPATAALTAAAIVKTEHKRDNIGLTHNGRWDFGTTAVSLYREVGTQTQWRRASQNPVVPELTNTVLDGLVSLPLKNNLLKLGGQYARSTLTGIAAQDAAPGGYGVNVNNVSLKTWALFAEDDYFVTDKLTVTAGARVDQDQRYGKAWTPRLYGVYQLSSAWTLRGGIAKGFKAPTLRQSTTGYCMTTGGAGGAVAGTLCGDSSLKPETSTTEEVGLRYEQAGSNLGFTLFNNDFKNKVASYDTGVADPRSAGRNIYIYSNIDRVSLRGIEVSAGTTLSREWKVSGNYTYTSSKRKGGGEPAFNGTSLEGYPLDKTPEHMINAQIDWTPSANVSLYGAVTYASKQYWAAFRNGAAGIRERAGSATFDVGGSYGLTKNLTLKFALLNITDKIVPVDERTRAAGLSGNWMVDEGRRLSLSLNATF